MRQYLRRLTALLLVLAMAAGALPLTALAAETDPSDVEIQEELSPEEEAAPDEATAPDEDDALRIVEPEELAEVLPVEETEVQVRADMDAPMEESLTAVEQVTEAAMMDGGGPISYAGAAGVPGGTVTSWTTITSSSQTLTDGWYAVTEDTVVPNRMTVRGSVDLILCDGCTLCAEKGITVIGSDSLTIWGQCQGTGALVVHHAEENAAGIGGLEGSYSLSANSGPITVNGGILDIWGGYSACAIGGGYSGHYGWCSEITINGGRICAIGSVQPDGTQVGSGAGIGGSGNSSSNAKSRINLNGGVIYAKGGYRSAGIGASQNQEGAQVTITGGDVTAYAGYDNDSRGNLLPMRSFGSGYYSNHDDGCLDLSDGCAITGGDREDTAVPMTKREAVSRRPRYLHIHYNSDVPSKSTASFSPGDGSGAMEDMACYSNICVLPESIFTPPEGKRFLHWAMDGKAHLPGSVVLLSADTVFTARYRDATPMELVQMAVEKGGTVALTEDVSITELDADFLTVPAGTDAVLDLNGHTLSFSSAGGEDPVLRCGMAVYGNLIVKDTSAAQTGTIRGASAAYAPVVVYPGAALRWEGGTLTGCCGQHTGGILDGSDIDLLQGRTDTASGSFTMTGGAITGNRSHNAGDGAGVSFRGPVHVSGKVNITDNRTQYSGGRYDEETESDVPFSVDVPSNLCAAQIIVDAPLDPASRIGVTVPAASLENGPIALTRGLKGNGALSNFFADDPSAVELYINRNDGELYARSSPAQPTEPLTQAKLDLQAAAVTATAQTYTGKALTPAPVVKLDGKTLTEGTDYTVTYRNNTNAGTAKVIVTGKGSYTGSKTGTFAIKKANQSMAVTAPASVVKGRTIKLTVKNAVGSVAFSTSNRAIATVSAAAVKGVKQGSVTITVKAAGDKNRNPCTRTVKITVYPLAPPPVSRVENVPGGVTITVGKVNGAARYRFFCKKGGGQWTRLGDSASNVFTWKKAANGVQYSFSACCLDKNSKPLSDCNRTGKSIVYIAAPTLKNTAAKTMKVSWKKAAGITGYQVQYGVKANFSGAKTVKITNHGTVSTTVKNLTAGKTWYVRVRTYTVKNGRTTYSAWSGSNSLRLTK